MGQMAIRTKPNFKSSRPVPWGGFGNFKNLLAVWRYGDDLIAIAKRRQCDRSHIYSRMYTIPDIFPFVKGSCAGGLWGDQRRGGRRKRDFGLSPLLDQGEAVAI